MEIVLKVQAETLLSKSSEILIEKNNIMSTMDQIKSDMTSLAASWKSPASDEYQSRFRQTYDDMDNVIAILSEYVMDLNTAAEKYKQVENTLVANAQSLPVDSVFK